MSTPELNYPKSSKGSFHISGTTTSPHPYVLAPAHVGYASKYHSGILTPEAIKAAEKTGISCGMKGCNLPYDKHEQILLVSCYEDIEAHKDDPDHPVILELKEYLQAHADQATAEGYAGFAFIDETGKKKEDSSE